MSTQELERLDAKLGQEVLYYHYHNKTVNADTLDELREIREEIMEEESSYFTAISQRVWTDYDKKEKELSGEVEVSEGKKSLEEINGISEPIPATNFRITDDELGQGTAKEKLDYLIYNDPIAYADLILNGDLETYLKTVTEYKPLDS